LETFMYFLLSVKCIIFFRTTFISRNQININQFAEFVKDICFLLHL